MKTRNAVALILAALLCGPVYAVKRSSSAKRAFVQEHVCPATGEHKTHCPGYVIDHIVPLCAGGADDPSNMQWQTIEDADAKDVLEHRQCRLLKSQKGE